MFSSPNQRVLLGVLPPNVFCCFESRGDPLPFPDGPDVVIASDVAYNDKVHHALVSTLTALFRRNGQLKAFIAFEARSRSEVGFFTLLHDAGLVCYKVHGDGGAKAVFIVLSPPQHGDSRDGTATSP